MTSLAELRTIEHERIAAEKAAVIAAEEGRRREIELAAQRVLDEERARVEAEREAILAIERAREQAEREARMRVEAAEAAERARHLAALEHERLAQEVELRRAEVARKRPTWMLAVTIAALVAAAGLSWFAVDQQQASAQALADKATAEEGRTAARAEVARAVETLAGFQADMLTLQGKVDRALADMEKARTAHERQEVALRLQKLREEELAIKKAKADEQERIWKKKRGEKFVIPEECKQNALTKKCLQYLE